MTEFKEKIRNFISPFLNGATLSDDDNIFKVSTINSLFALQLILYMEKEFAIKFNLMELNIDKLSSINKISDVLQRKLG